MDSISSSMETKFIENVLTKSIYDTSSFIFVGVLFIIFKDVSNFIVKVSIVLLFNVGK